MKYDCDGRCDDLEHLRMDKIRSLYLESRFTPVVIVENSEFHPQSVGSEIATFL